jgi:hypothetical protein
MTNKRFTLPVLLIFLLVSAVLSACNSNAESIETTAAEPVQATEPDTATANTDAAPVPTDLPPTIDPVLLQPPEPVDVCLLVSKEEAAAFLGSDITSVENEPGDHTGQCKYIAQTSIDRLHLKISWTPNFGAGDYEVIHSTIQNPREEGTDVGDTFYIRDELTGVQLRTVRGEQYLVLEAYGVTEPDAALKELAQKILAANP